MFAILFCLRLGTDLVPEMLDFTSYFKRKVVTNAGTILTAGTLKVHCEVKITFSKNFWLNVMVQLLPRSDSRQRKRFLCSARGEHTTNSSLDNWRDTLAGKAVGSSNFEPIKYCSS